MITSNEVAKSAMESTVFVAVGLFLSFNSVEVHFHYAVLPAGCGGLCAWYAGCALPGGGSRTDQVHPGGRSSRSWLLRMYINKNVNVGKNDARAHVPETNERKCGWPQNMNSNP
jgi:hypothetical protein